MGDTVKEIFMKFNVIYLQGGRLFTNVNDLNPDKPARRVVTNLTIDDLKGDKYYKSQEDMLSFFTVAGDPVTVTRCQACGGLMDTSKTRVAAGLTQAHSCL